MSTLLDLAILNGSDGVAGLIEDVIRSFPEFTVVPSRTIRGENYRTAVRTAWPTASFRDANEGVASSRSVFENRLVSTYIANVRFVVDKAIADRYEDGAEAYLALEASGQMFALMNLLASQFYYGSNTKGFPGLVQALDSSMVVDAGGSSSPTSVFAVRVGPQDVTWVWGQNGTLSLSDVRTESVLDSSSNPYTAYVQEFLAYPGLQVGNVHCVGRVRNIADTSGNRLTDAHIANLLSRFPAGMPPTALFMNRTAWRMLQQSRTATTPTGQPAPFPSDSFGIPIYITDAIVNGETV